MTVNLVFFPLWLLLALTKPIQTLTVLAQNIISGQHEVNKKGST